ncbi:CDP-diacylglycerol--glycerol-3-phosphate 3-phosphatidyltransferase [Kribbella amoyensis]|uniref:CDP-diacylglycerol--glycerol-3-phosphate 3-phosphatidyltransferase n=1 Tax=Kribbella amoyensis TaxID=996641 RepID=A0A561BMP4_9ACTN|nr:CDP-alcohol phosphatidyltransferase family protein [Kribbella amoyensis]TWD80118.1 CDP-diacylglycerol--glycerol-3-phosphate 3-phosphatidyltransferase [Kribbella amoyensis]
MSTTHLPRPVSVELLLGWPNRITLVRTVIAMAVATAAFLTGDFVWLVAGYLTYWLGDSLDGGVARYLKQETVVGAVFDIVCDRACCSLLAAAFMATYPEVVGPLAIFLFQFGVLDTMLSLAFLLWPDTLSPNYFYKVDQKIYIWNWSRIAKGLNTGAVVVSLVIGQLTGFMELPYAVALAAVVVKSASLYRLLLIITGRRPAVPAVR